mgnify:CR=1 FL=1
MALLELEERTGHSDEVRKLIQEAKALIERDISGRALRRLTPVNVETKVARMIVANDNLE